MADESGRWDGKFWKMGRIKGGRYEMLDFTLDALGIYGFGS